MNYGIVNHLDVPEETKNAAYAALKIAQERLDIPDNIKIVFFAEFAVADRYSKNAELFFDCVESKMRAKAKENTLYVNFMQYVPAVKESVLAACWIMKVNKYGNIYCKANAIPDDFINKLIEDALGFAGSVLKGPETNDIKVNFIQSESQNALFLLKSMSIDEFQNLVKNKLSDDESFTLYKLINKLRKES